LVFYIDEEKRKDKEKKRAGLRACKPLYAPSAQDKEQNRYSILKKTKEKT